MSEPAIVKSKSPGVTSLSKKLCCASSAESLDGEGSIIQPQSQTRPTLLKIKSADELEVADQDTCSSADVTKPSAITPVSPPKTPPVKVFSVDTKAFSFPPQQSLLANEQNITFGQMELVALSPLHIDSVVFESVACCGPAAKADKDDLCAAAISRHSYSTEDDGEKETGQVNCSRLIDALDIQSPAHFTLGVSSGLQSTPYKMGLQFGDELCTPPRVGTTGTVIHEREEFSSHIFAEVQNQQLLSPENLESEKRRVAEHIQHFNKLTLHSPRGIKNKQIKSPLRFQRTPVRQAVRRINSLLGDNRRPTRTCELSTGHSQVVKAVSLESGLSPHPQLKLFHEELQEGRRSSMCPGKKPPPVPPKKTTTLSRKPKVCALGDVTNVVQPKTKIDSSALDPSGGQKPLVQQVAEKNYYRGSPRNPLNQGRLLSATKPVDL